MKKFTFKNHCLKLQRNKFISFFIESKRINLYLDTTIMITEVFTYINKCSYNHKSNISLYVDFKNFKDSHKAKIIPSDYSNLTIIFKTDEREYKSNLCRHKFGKIFGFIPIEPIDLFFKFEIK